MGDIPRASEQSLRLHSRLLECNLIVPAEDEAGGSIPPGRTKTIVTETARASEQALARDWNRPAEDKTWANL